MNTFTLTKDLMFNASTYFYNGVRSDKDLMLSSAVHYLLLGKEKFNSENIEHYNKIENTFLMMIRSCYLIYFVQVSTPTNKQLFIDYLNNIVETTLQSNKLDITYTVALMPYRENSDVLLHFMKGDIEIKIWFTL